MLTPLYPLRKNKGLGDDTMLKPAIQIVYAYTTMIPIDDGVYQCEKDIVSDEEEMSGDEGMDGVVGIAKKWAVVRRCTVYTTNLETSRKVESVFSSLDCEALALSLFHKFWSASIDHGIAEANRLANDWLVGTLTAVYRSAEAEEARMIDEGERLEEHTGYKYRRNRKRNSMDVKNRLLNRNSSLSESEVLLGQGHELLSSLPFLIYSLLNCDALRRADGAFRPSSDARICAALNIFAMNPSAFVKLIAPRLECWADPDSFEHAVERVSLSQYGITMALATLESDSNMSCDPVMFIDSPGLILIHYPKHKVDRAGSGGRELAEVGDELKLAVIEAGLDYSIRPPLKFTRAGTEGAWYLQDFLIEDSPVLGGYEDWCNGCVDSLKNQLFLS